VRELLIILVVVAVIAVIWYLRRQSSGPSAQPKSIGRRLTVEATPAKNATVAARVTPPETGPPTSVPGPAEKGAGLFQVAAASAAGAPYVRAADEIEDMTAELSHARRDAERAAERLAYRASEAVDAIQAAAAVGGGAVPGDGSDRCPPRYPVKGDLATMRYRNAGDPTYDQAVPDVCFQSVAAAEAAGLTESGDESRL
jgi:hypothetical protein